MMLRSVRGDELRHVRQTNIAEPASHLILKSDDKRAPS